MEGSRRSYLGVVHVEYASGNSGIAYAPTVRRPSSALAWDFGDTPGSPSYQRVAAHEVGHMLGLLHAPCGSPMPAGLDPTWPTGAAYAGAHIGVFGWDPLDGSVKSPASVFDLMSYCGSIASTWTSDHDYRRVLDFLAGPDATAPTSALEVAGEAAVLREPCLVVAGRLRAGLVDLEPAYVVETIPSLPAPGAFALDLLDASGARLASVPFEPDLVVTEQAGDVEERHFAFALPISSEQAGALRGLAVTERGVVVQRAAASGAASASGRAATLRLGESGGHASLDWDAGAFPGALVRDPRTGAVLAFLRGGAGAVRTEAPELEVLLSDGVRTRERVLLRR